MIDSRAVISPQAQIGADVTIGPFSIIGADVVIGAGTWIGPHVVINGPTRLGTANKVFQFASLGDAPRTRNTTANRRGSKSATAMYSANPSR
jgi:UDP-N-acetylglucosamine acyltransferase